MKRLVLVLSLATLLLAASALRADNSFYRVTAVKPNATVADGVRAFFILALDTDPGDIPYARQARALIDMKIIPKSWADKGDDKLTRGKVAYMMCTACGIKGGLTMHIFGPSERYCYHEMTYMGMMVNGTPRDYVSGSELIGALAQAADYVEKHPKGKRKPTEIALAIKREAEEATAKKIEELNKQSQQKPAPAP